MVSAYKGKRDRTCVTCVIIENNGGRWDLEKAWSPINGDLKDKKKLTFAE